MKLTARFVTVLLALVFVWLPAAAQEKSWEDRITLKGDLRLRYEGINEDGEADRERMRFRSRFGLTATLNDDVQVVLQLATGGGNPVSTNQTFDDGFSTKDIGVDLAYIDWKVTDYVNFHGGKIKNPQFRAGGASLIWDSDLNLEGFALKYSNSGLFATIGGYSVEERSSVDDSLLYTIQAGYRFPIGDNMTLVAGGGYFAYTDTIGNSPFFDGRSKGNSVDIAGNYVFDYRDTELFAELDTKVGAWPLKIFAQVVQNNEVSVEDRAFAVGAKVGAAKSEGDVEFSWTFQDIEADSVIATFNDSDFGGGGTDSDGHILKAKYSVRKQIFLGGTLFLNDVDQFQGTAHDYSRIQIDVEFKFN